MYAHTHMTDSEPRNEYVKSIFITHTSQYGEVMGNVLAAALPCGTEAEKAPHQGPSAGSTLESPEELSEALPPGSRPPPRNTNFSGPKSNLSIQQSLTVQKKSLEN